MERPNHPPATATQWSSWQHPQLTTKIASAHLHFRLFMLTQTGEKETKNPRKDLAGFDGECSYEKPQNDELLTGINVPVMWTVSS